MVKNKRILEKQRWKSNNQEVKVRVKGQFSCLPVKIRGKCSE